MKVKKLEWESKNNNQEWVSSNGFYTITNIGANKWIIIDGLGYKSFATHFYIGQKDCQDHFEKFILSQIENDHIMIENDITKPFDPLLIGFEYTGVDPQEGKEYLLWFDGEKTILSGKIYHNQTYNTWLINFDNLYIESIEIPNHYFGAQLISQFLGEKTDGN